MVKRVFILHSNIKEWYTFLKIMEDFVDLIFPILRVFLSLPLGVFAGFATVYIFNRIPAKWLCEYDEDPGKEMWGIRVRRYPFGWILSLIFIVSLFVIRERTIPYQIAAFFAIWILLLVALSDIKYMIIPDQLVIALATSSIGFIPGYPDLIYPVQGTLIGGGSLLIIGAVGKYIFKKDSLGFGDVKLMAAVGLIAGTKGTIVILVLTILSAGIIMSAGVLANRINKQDERPLGPYIAIFSSLYILFTPHFLLVADLYMGR
jgi:prepilin signal peptidase PulO-like enzyme (type II secretory pathway)